MIIGFIVNKCLGPGPSGGQVEKLLKKRKNKDIYTLTSYS